MSFFSRLFGMCFHKNGHVKNETVPSIREVRQQILDEFKDETVRLLAESKQNYIQLQEEWKAARPSNGNGRHAPETAP